MVCPNCGHGTDWVIVGGGNGLLPGWGRWKCKGCDHVGIAEFEELHREMALRKSAEKAKRKEEQESKQAGRQRYLNNWGKRMGWR